MKLLFILPLLLLLASCGNKLKSDDTASTENPAPVEINEDESESRPQLIVSEITSDPSLPPYKQEEIDFLYNWKIGKCLSILDDGENDGLNPDHIGECGDMMGSSLDGIDFTIIRLPGGNIRGADLQNAKVEMYGLIYDEVVFDQDTIFPDAIPYPFNEAIKATEKILISFKGKINSGKANEIDFINYQRELKNKLKDETDEQEIERLINEYTDSKNKLIRIQETNKAKRAKFDRHKDESIRLGDFAEEDIAAKEDRAIKEDITAEEVIQEGRGNRNNRSNKVKIDKAHNDYKKQK